MPKRLVCTPSGVSQETALSWETTTDTQHQRNKRCARSYFLVSQIIVLFTEISTVL